MDDFGVGFLMGLMVTLFAVIVFLAIITDDPNTRYYKHVCEYKHGTYHGNLCVRDGEVVKIQKRREAE
jgi:hypothetical protein